MDIPGFVDLQVNGYAGVSFCAPDLTADTLAATCRKVLSAGTAAFLPTLSTSPMGVYERNLPLIAQAIDSQEFRGRLLGIHIEGPFISPEPGPVGAHNPKWVRPADVEMLRRIFDLAEDNVRILTIAAEIDGAEDLARCAVARGATVSVGHSMATPEDLQRLVAAGATAFTHLGNGLPNLIHRHHNPIWAALANDAITAMLIADGHHLPPSALKAMIRAKGAARTVVVSDASHLAGMPPGRYRRGDDEVVLETSGKLHIPSKHCLTGSSATMTQCMNHLASLDLLTGQELVAVGFENPLRLIGLDGDSVRAPGRTGYDQAARAFSWSQ